MDNNKNRRKDRPKSVAELRKIEPNAGKRAGENLDIPHNINKEALGPNTNR